MRFYYDLHMHSSLSPCGDGDMSPNNIVNMSIVNGLDIIALSDHNCAKNLPAVMEAARGKNILVVPALEAESAEEVHMLCLFKSVDDALMMSDMLYDALPDIKNRPEIFGEQNISDGEDEVCGVVDKLLINATSLDIYAINTAVRKMGGVCIPAHIDRASNSILSNLGFIPPDINFATLELSKRADPLTVWDERYHYIHNSDAHYLEDIAQRRWSIDLPERSAEALIEKLATNLHN